MEKKKIIGISFLALAFIGLTYGGYRWYQYLRTKSGDPQKNNRKIVIKRNFLDLWKTDFL
jgi:hypothetical protein